MALRRPPAHPRRPSAMRRSGDQSYWDSLMSEGEPGYRCRPSHSNRPQSAIEGGQLDGWLEQLYRMQSNQISGLSSRTSSTTTLDREPSGSTAIPQIAPSFKRGSPSFGTRSHCASSLGSQESLQTGFCSSADRRGSWERAHITEAPNKEQTQFSNLSPVKIGWLPIQRRVMKVSGASDQSLDVSPGLVKLKQPITPMIQIGRATNSICQGTEVERSDSRHGAASGRTWLTPDQGSTIIKQVPEKQCSTYREVNKPVGWQALRRGFKISRQPSVTTASPAAASSLDQQKERQCTAEPNKSPAFLQSPVSPVSQASLRSGQPLRATGPVCVSNSGSAVTTIVPQGKGSFSSITISSRKVNRSASLPGSDSSYYKNSDSNSQKFTMQRNATIVKVTEQRTIEERVPPLNSLDTVVQRRKATIIKVTEHRESYSPASGRNGTRHPAYRHSYTEGSHNNIQSNAAVPYHRVDFSEKSSDSVPPYSPGLVKNSDQLHTSTISVFVNNPPAIAAPVREVTPSPKRSVRPASCYDIVFEPQTEHGKHPLVRKWSFETPEVASNPENPGRNFVKSEASPVVVDGTSTYKRDKPFLPQTDDVLKRSSASLTPVKASDPQTPQSPEDILALNAAAVIASIKQLSSQRKKTNGSAERDSNASPRGNIVTHEGKCVKIQQSQAQRRLPQATFVPLNNQSLGETISLQEALRRSRPHFITRSQTRVQKVERRAQERRERAKMAKPQRKWERHARTPSLHAIVRKPTEATMKPVQFTSTWTRENCNKKSEEEKEKKKNEPLLNSRQRIEMFKKRLWDQLLQRSNK